jgi:hypothetical protein
MERVDIVLNLPEELVEQAKSAGLLTNERIEKFLLSELERQRRLKGFFTDLDKLAAITPPISEEEIAAEIDAYRKEKNQRKASNGQ